jgi:hypothetical protein
MSEDTKEFQNWKDIVTLVHASFRNEEQSIHDVRFWQNLDAQTRLAAAWQIAKEVHVLQGKRKDELRMDKSKGRVVHRSEAERPFDSSKNFVYTVSKEGRTN